MRNIITLLVLVAVLHLPSILYAESTGRPVVRPLHSDAELVEARPGITRAENLTLIDRDVTDKSLASLVGMNDLRELHICNAAITTAGLRTLTRLPKLQQLFLVACTIDADGMRVIGSLQGLRGLTLARIELACDPADISMATLSGLESLTITDSHLRDDGLQAFGIARMQNLRRANLRNIGLTDASINNIVGLDHVEDLCLACNNITTTGVSKLKSMKSLHELLMGNSAAVQSDSRKSGFVQSCIDELSMYTVSSSLISAAGLSAAVALGLFVARRHTAMHSVHR